MMEIPIFVEYFIEYAGGRFHYFKKNLTIRIDPGHMYTMNLVINPTMLA